MKVKLQLIDGVYSRFMGDKRVGFTHESLADLYNETELGEYDLQSLLDLGVKHGTPISLPEEHNGFLSLARSNDMGLFYAYMALSSQGQFQKEELHGVAERHIRRGYK